MPRKKQTIALITAHGWIGISTPVIMTARYLTQQGYDVDLYMDEDDLCRDLGIDRPQLNEPSINILTYPRLKSDATQTPGTPTIPSGDESFVRRAGERKKTYEWLVGFDPHGLIRAACLSRVWNTPFIYHSLELYDREDDLKRLERSFSKQALLAITQDRARADILAGLNAIDRDRIAVLYNTTLDPVVPEKKDYFRNKFALTAETVVVLAIGTLLPEHGIDLFLQTAPNWPNRFALVLHGWIPDKTFAGRIQDRIAEYPRRLFLSTDILPPAAKSIAFQSADIGLVYYAPINTNFIYAGGSAGKIFDFMRAGVPMLVNHSPGMPELIEDNGCGKIFREIREIGALLPEITKHYAVLRENALKSHAKYDFAESYDRIMATIRNRMS
ncbi:MAG: hypothetical protein EHM45_16735 [Desulfobacteraceae bacterium]|nr:MAG: hypothetical protein EHM45_16735 [Desulfobacteraceae bacterium]